jgi:hypothetical protein
MSQDDSKLLDPSPDDRSGDSASWARPIEQVVATGNVTDPNLLNNVDGRILNGPLQGFGRMWRKRHHVRIDDADVDPTHVISTWKGDFGSFWPRGNKFYGPITGLKPGEVALIDISMPGAQRLSTGVLVLYADDESFSLMTPQGHIFAGWITFSSYRDAGDTLVQADILMRASDPLYEVGMEVMGHRRENKFWEQTLANVANRFGSQGKAVTEVELIDPRRQWKYAGNVRHNSAIRTGIYRTTAPLRKLRRS